MRTVHREFRSGDYVRWLPFGIPAVIQACWPTTAQIIVSTEAGDRMFLVSKEHLVKDPETYWEVA